MQCNFGKNFRVNITWKLDRTLDRNLHRNLHRNKIMRQTKSVCRKVVLKDDKIFQM